MPKAFAWILVAVAALVVALFGLAIGVAITVDDPPQGGLATDLGDVVVSSDERPAPQVEPEEPEPAADQLCWSEFGGDLLRSLARPGVRLGTPRSKPVWSRGMDDLMEYPPTYCNGQLYVNLEHGVTVALNAQTGKIRWRRRAGGLTVSSPALAGDRLIVSSHAGTVTALRRTDGKRIWQSRQMRRSNHLRWPSTAWHMSVPTTEGCSPWTSEPDDRDGSTTWEGG